MSVMIKTNQYLEGIGLCAVLCWNLWKARNLAVFEGKEADPIQVWIQSQSEYFEFFNANQPHSLPEEQHGPSSPSSTGWMAPEDGWIKLNCKASFDKDSEYAGLVVVARNSLGAIVGVSTSRIRARTAFVADAMAFNLASELISKKKWDKVILESDSRGFTERMIAREKYKTWETEAIEESITSFLSCTSYRCFNFVKKHCNLAALWMATRVRDLSLPPNWPTANPFL